MVVRGGKSIHRPPEMEGLRFSCIGNLGITYSQEWGVLHSPSLKLDQDYRILLVCNSSLCFGTS